MFDISAINVLFVKPEITKITDTKIDLHTKLPKFQDSKLWGFNMGTTAGPNWMKTDVNLSAVKLNSAMQHQKIQQSFYLTQQWCGFGRNAIWDEECCVGRNTSSMTTVQTLPNTPSELITHTHTNTQILLITVGRPLLLYGYSYKASCARPG